MRKITAIIVAAVLLPASALADEPTDPRADIAAMIPGLSPDDVHKAPMDGLYEVAMGSQIFYVSDDGKYLFKGDIIDLTTNESITEKRRSGLRLAEVNQLGDDDMVIFGPADAKHTITVFTDVDCTYCRKLHQEMAQLNASSIRIRYVFFPRFGPGSESWAKAEAVWCSEDRQSAMTAAKNGEELIAKACPNPVEEHYSLGNKVGVRGTPALMMEDGQLFPGYVPAAELAAFLEQG